MKQLLICALLAVVIAGCAKNNKTDDPIPVASFTIKNTVEPGTVMEATAVEFENNSTNCDSYEWDFGDGRMSMERTPAGVEFRQCPAIRQIRLTVRTRRGRTATILQEIRVRCR